MNINKFLENFYKRILFKQLICLLNEYNWLLLHEIKCIFPFFNVYWMDWTLCMDWPRSYIPKSRLVMSYKWNNIKFKVFFTDINILGDFWKYSQGGRKCLSDIQCQV